MFLASVRLPVPLTATAMRAHAGVEIERDSSEAAAFMSLVLPGV